ncbi:transporter [bacterium 1XD42-1]|nr:transporter [bacterium 1XD42-8]RKJ62206.1 transporter [bacterium 1XD42-1]
MGDKKVKNYLLLYTAFFLFSITSVMNKLASGNGFFSLNFFFFYGLGLFILFLYAILWQKVLMQFDLAVAYANRPIVTLLGVIWGVLLFHEPLKWNMVLGAAIILVGIRLMVREHEK